MNDYISRQAAINVTLEDGAYGYISTQELWELPAADVVEVVRCKDCKHYNAGFECLIEGYGIERDKDWYCADGERKDG